MHRRPSPDLFLAFLLLLPLTGGSEEMPPIGIIDFYGLRGGVSEAQARRALPFGEGDPMPESVEAAVRQLEAVPGVRKAVVDYDCCEEGRGIVYVGIEERGAPVLGFRSPPQGTIRLPVEIREAGRALDQARFEAVRRGNAGEDHALGHALADDPVVRALQEKLPALASQHLALLREVLHAGAEEEDRALAAQILGYAPNKSEVVDDLAFGMHDPDAGVRNDSMRALWVIASFAKRSPQLGIRVSPEPFVEMLDSLVWSDRNKASAALFALSEARDAALLGSLRERALPSLAEMARFKSPGHALAPFYVLGRLGGLTEEEIFAAWSRPHREAAVLDLEKRARTSPEVEAPIRANELPPSPGPVRRFVASFRPSPSCDPPPNLLRFVSAVSFSGPELRSPPRGARPLAWAGTGSAS